MVKCYKTKNLDSYYLEMGATEGFLKGEIKTLVDKLRDKEEEIKKLKSDLAFKNTMLDNVSAEYESSQDIIKKLQERIRFLEECLDNKEKVNKSLREELGKFIMNNPS